jgi:hypothetical protein
MKQLLLDYTGEEATRRQTRAQQTRHARHYPISQYQKTAKQVITKAREKTNKHVIGKAIQKPSHHAIPNSHTNT